MLFVIYMRVLFSGSCVSLYLFIYVIHVLLLLFYILFHDKKGEKLAMKIRGEFGFRGSNSMSFR